MAASASSRRPSAASAVGLVVQRPGEVGAERVRAGRGQLPVDLDGLGDGGQRVLAPAQPRQRGGLVVQRPGEVGAERVGAGRGQLPVDLDGLGDGGQGVLAPAQLGQPVGLVVQRPGEVGAVPGWVVGGEAAVVDDGLAGERGGEVGQGQGVFGEPIESVCCRGGCRYLCAGRR